MATKTIQTRIKNRFDTLANWQGTGVTLLPGEIALVSVTTQQIDKDTGDVVNVPAVLMKVGESDGNGGSKAFDSLPWVSALAADVYDWAKNATAEEVPVTIMVGTTSTPGTLGGWIKSINDKAATNASNISANTTAITKLNGSDTTAGSVAKAIKDAIEALDVTTSSGTGNFVKAVTQTNGKISVTKGAIAETDLPSISSDKITIGTGTTDGTLSKKLSTMDAAIAANTSKLAGHTDAAINTLIDNKINALDVSDSGSGYVTKVTQTDGKIAVTKAALPTAGTSTAGITKLYTSVGTSTDGTVTRKVVNDINTQVETNKTDIANLKTAVAGGVHFRGTITAAPSASTTTVNNVTITAGDVIIYDGKEYICTAVTEGAPSWEQLGDVTRIGNLETKINNLDYSTVTDGAATNSKFVSKVTQTDGKIAATYARPSASDISYGSSSDVNTKLGSIDAEIANKANSADVYTKGQTDNAISTAIGNLDFTAPTASGNTTSFIDSVSQTDGKITATKKTITSASTSAKGIVQLSSAVDSTSEALAATPKAVKSAYDLAAEAKADAAAKAPASHEHSAYVNQNAFSKIAVNGQTTVEADNATDTVTFAGSNVTITTDATNDKVTFTVASGSTSAKGIVQLNNTVTSTSTSLAATANAVKTAYDKGAEGVAAAAAIAGNYVKISNDNLVNQAGDVIIFDCGGAADL